MGDFKIENVNAMCLDVLKEIASIGSGNAATSLSQMINKRVNMTVPGIEVMDINDVVDMFADPMEPVIGVYMSFRGDIEGTILTLLDENSAGKLIKCLVGKEPEGLNYNDVEISVIQELGNIMTSGYVNSIAMFSKFFMKLSVPSVCVDMVSSILSVPAIEYGMDSDKMIVIENQLDMDGEDLDCFFFFMPDINSFEKLFIKLGVL